MDNTPLSFPMSKLGGRYCPRENDQTDQTPASCESEGGLSRRPPAAIATADGTSWASPLVVSPALQVRTAPHDGQGSLRVRGGGCGASKASLPVRTPHRMHSQSVTHSLLCVHSQTSIFFPGRGGGGLFLLRALHAYTHPVVVFCCAHLVSFVPSSTKSERRQFVDPGLGFGTRWPECRKWVTRGQTATSSAGA